MTYSSCCFPSPSPTLHFPLKLLSVPLGKSTDWHFPLKEKTRKCRKGKDEVHSHADHITPLWSGSSGITSSSLKLTNQKLNNCLHKVKLLKHRALKTDHGSWGWLITHLELSQYSKTLLKHETISLVATLSLQWKHYFSPAGTNTKGSKYISFNWVYTYLGYESFESFGQLVNKSEWDEIPLVMSQLLVTLQLRLPLPFPLHGKALLWECFTDDLQPFCTGRKWQVKKKRVLLYHAVNIHKLPTNIIW